MTRDTYDNYGDRPWLLYPFTVVLVVKLVTDRATETQTLDFGNAMEKKRV